MFGKVDTLETYHAGLRLSIAMILPRWNMVEGGTAHGWERSTDQLVCLEVLPYLSI